jgi:hypothetical protein
VFDIFVAIRGTEMTGAEVGLQEREVAVCFVFPQLGDPFQWLPISNARVVQASSDEKGRVCLSANSREMSEGGGRGGEGYLCGDIGVRTVATHVLIIFLLVWISPLFPLPLRE